MKVIVYSTSAGEVHVVRPAPGAQRAGETEGAFLDRIRQRQVPRDARSVVLIDDADLPADRGNRAGWRIDRRRGRVLPGKTPRPAPSTMPEAP